MPEDELSLKALIQAVSEELRSSRTERLAQGLPALFEVEDLTIEVSFVVTRSKGGGVGFDLKVISADGSVKYDRESVQKITLKLKALADEDVLLPELPDTLPLRPRSDD